MEYSVTIGSIIGIMMAAFAIIQYLKGRDNAVKEQNKEESERDKMIISNKIEIGIYKKELEKLQGRVDNLDMKLMDEIKSLHKKMDGLIMNLMDNKK